MAAPLDPEREALIRELSDTPLYREQTRRIRKNIRTMDMAEVRNALKLIRSMKRTLVALTKVIERLKKK